MDRYKQNWTRLQKKVFRFLSMNVGKAVNQRNIAKSLKVSPTAVGKSLPFLEDLKLITINKEGNLNLKLIELNQDSEDSIYFKKLENLRLIYVSGLIFDLKNTFSGSTIILFGSYARGEDIFSSDIDIAIIGCKEKGFNFYKKYEKLLEREIVINFYDSFKEIHKNLKENLFNGVLISGSIEL